MDDFNERTPTISQLKAQASALREEIQVGWAFLDEQAFLIAEQAEKCSDAELTWALRYFERRDMAAPSGEIA